MRFSIIPLIVLTLGASAIAGVDPRSNEQIVADWVATRFEENGWASSDCPDALSVPKDSLAWCAVASVKAKPFRKAWDRSVAKSPERGRWLLAWSKWNDSDDMLKRSYRFVSGRLDVAYDIAGGGVAAVFTPIRGALFERLVTTGEVFLDTETRKTGNHVNPQRTRYDSPEFPIKARRDRVSAYVIAEMLIGEDGAVRDIGIIDCNKRGFGFEESARRSINRWQYEPATLDGEPVPAYVVVTVTFELQ